MLNNIIDIPLPNDKSLTVQLTEGDTVFIVGANGSGKSSLLHKLFLQFSDNVKRVSAHRQNWFESTVLDLSPATKKSYDQNILHQDRDARARWREDYSAQRPALALYELIQAYNNRSNEIAAAADDKKIQKVKTLSQVKSSITIINELLEFSKIPISVKINNNDLVACRNGSEYSISELSDGERNALLIASSVLTAKPGCVIIIDEPERHLHQSIISKLLIKLFENRQDCTFIISTHDLNLPSIHKSSKTIILREIEYLNGYVLFWKADLLDSLSKLDDRLKEDILGARENILFVEGRNESLDKALYEILFPDTTVIPKGNCRDVINAVESIKSAGELHWLNAKGVIDNDGRTDTEIKLLKSKDIFVLPCYSIESIYYNEKVMQFISEKYPMLHNKNPEILNELKSIILSLNDLDIERLSVRVLEKQIREIIFNNLPLQKNIKEEPLLNISIPMAELLEAEKFKFKEAIKNQNTSFIISRYPIRETSILNKMVKQLGFLNKELYEATVIDLLSSDKTALNLLKILFFKD